MPKIVNLAKQTIKDFKGMAAAGANSVIEDTMPQIFPQFIIGIIAMIIFAIMSQK